MAEASRKFLREIYKRASNLPFIRSSSSCVHEDVIVSREEMTEFAFRCLKAAGTKESHARAVSEVLVTADYRGHYSHGVNRLEMYVNDIKSGITSPGDEPKILKESACTAWIDGMNALGPVVGNFCMKLAIEKAKKDGIGWIVAKGSNHYGIAGWYSLQAADVGLLGMSFTNTSPLACTTRGKTAMLGTNPLSLSAPAEEGQTHFCLDMATSTAAVGKIEICDRKNVNMPRNWGADSAGHETVIPAETLNGGALLPLGGSEITGGYKGYGLSMLVEIFCGILGGATYGPNIRKWKTCDRVANLGQCFIAVNPDFFAPGFDGRLSDIMNLLRSQPPADGETEVLVAGDPEERQMKKCDSEGGIRYHANVISHLYELGESLSVEPFKNVEQQDNAQERA